MNDRLSLEVKFSVEDSGSVFGIAWPFGLPDQSGDLIQKGAFGTLAGPIPMLWAHDQAQVIGKWDSLAEDASGLKVKGSLNLEVAKAREVHSLMKTGAVSGLSIGFRTKSAEPRRGGGRTIKALDLKEISIVAIPMHPDARVITVKSASAEESEKKMETEEIQKKIGELEAKAAKVDKIESDLKAALKRADELELKMNRPGASAISGDQAAELEKKAISSFLRGGVGRLSADETKFLSLESKSLVLGDPNASVLAPPQFAQEIIKNLVLFSPIRSVARVMAISAGEVVIPRRTGKLTASWVAEAAAKGATSPNYDNAKIVPQELGCYVDVSNQLLEDSAFDIASEIARDFGEEFGRAEGAAFVAGTGIGQPEGLLVNQNVVQIHSGITAISGTGSSSATVFAASLVNFFYSLPSPYAANGSWLINRSTIGVIRTLQNSVGQFLWIDGLQAGAPGTLLGRPVIEVPDMPGMASAAIPIMFGDVFSAYRIVDRVSLAIIRDPYTQAVNGMTRFHARRRVGGQVVKAEAIRSFLMSV